MRNAMRVLLALLAAASPAASSAEPLSERAASVAALQAAYEAMDKGHLKSEAKVIEIRRKGDLIVVSFLNPTPKYGGQAHVTYDPKSKKVTDVEGEE